MAKLIVKIDIPDRTAAELREEIAAAQADPGGTGTWVSTEDGAENVVVDNEYLTTAAVDDACFVFEYVGVAEE